MDQLQYREIEVFNTLKKLVGFRFVLIGGYAVNAYALPRFSVDCDIVVRNKAEATSLEKVLCKFGYMKNPIPRGIASVDFARYEKTVATTFKVSFDAMMGTVTDRQTGATFSADWIFKNSKIRLFKGKTITEKLRVRVINPEALFVMKIISCRSSDIRDVFMMAPYIKDKKWVKSEVSSRYSFSNRLRKIKGVIGSREFRNGIQGVYGLIDNQIFKRSIKAINSFATT